MSTERYWMYQRFLDNGQRNPAFKTGIEYFVRFAFAHPNCVSENKIRCPCSKCKNKNWYGSSVVLTHLSKRGFFPDYYVWTDHGESIYSYDIGSSSVPQYHSGEGSSVPQYHSGEGMFYDAPEPVYTEPQQPPPNPFLPMVMEMGAPDFNPDIQPEETDPFTNNLYDLHNAAKESLYGGSSHSKLGTVTRMVNIKSDHNMSDSCYNDLSSLLKDILPKDNTLPSNFYETKKIISKMGLPYEEIDCCENYCMLYWRIDKDRVTCKVCGAKRYKEKKIGTSKRTKDVAKKKMTYLPITPRLQRLYKSSTTAADMRWHERHDTEPGVMNHPSDSPAWKHFDNIHTQFRDDPRNVRLGLCTDGFSVHGQYGANYSSWPIVLTVYNLPPWLCMKEEYMFLSVLCPGPKNPKHKVDVFLQPLIAELQDLWTKGIETWDAAIGRKFLMRAALLWTVSDFPAYAMLSGWSTAGKKACPYCMQDTEAFWLDNGHKMSWFDCHRRFLPHDHPYRSNVNDFYKDRSAVNLEPPEIYDGERILLHITSLGLKKVTEPNAERDNKIISERYNSGWKKRSIFWDLPYWKTLLIRHNLDVMHIEKNVFENIFNTIMNIPTKTKDNVKSRLDLRVVCNRPQLDSIDGGRTYPKAPYQLLPEQISATARWVKQLKFPDGFVSNLGRLTQLGTRPGRENFKSGWKSHDCHIFMQKLLPIATKKFLDKNVWEALTGLSMFFRDLTSTSLSIEKMVRWETDIAVIMCSLERIFPPSFFDVMEHLVIHLPYEARIAGPVSSRWMYPFERNLRTLKKTAKNKARIEGSILNAYITKEAALLCSQYFEPNVVTKQRRVRRNDDGGNVIDQNSNIPFIFTFWVALMELVR